MCQHLENVAGDVLEKYADIIRAYVRRRVGIYALYRKGKLYYVGLAGNLRTRLKQHLRDRHKGLWDRFSVYLTIDDNHLRELESLVLRTMRPPGNKQRGKFARSEDLRRRLTRDIRVYQRDELNRLIGKRTTPARPVEDEQETFALATYVTASLKLRAAFHGSRFKALVNHAGAIRFGGELYGSPSAAARRVTGRATNGWTFWEFERAPGQWVLLDDLRK